MSDLLDDLRAYADWIEPKCFMSQDDLRALVWRAIDRIQRLESLTGAVSQGNGDFRSVKTLLPHAGTSFADIVDEMEKNPDSGQTPARYTGC